MDGNDVKYLRDKATRLRDLARAYDTKLAETLLRLADEFDEKATEIAARSGSVPC
jgi:hypothetical protein